MAELTAWATPDRAERIRPRRSSSSFAGEDPSRIRGVGTPPFLARFPALLKGYRVGRPSPGENTADPLSRVRFSGTSRGHTVLPSTGLRPGQPRPFPGPPGRGPDEPSSRPGASGSDGPTDGGLIWPIPLNARSG